MQSIISRSTNMRLELSSAISATLDEVSTELMLPRTVVVRAILRDYLLNQDCRRIRDVAYEMYLAEMSGADVHGEYKDAGARYRASDKGKAVRARYRASDKGKAAHARAVAKYQASDKGKAARLNDHERKKSGDGVDDC